MPRAKKEILPQKSSIEKKEKEEKKEEKGGEKKSSSKSDPKVMKEYFRLQREFFFSHGPRIFLLMQIGAFYEIYGIRMRAIGGLNGTSMSEEKEEFNPESLMSEFLELTDYKKMEKGQCIDGKEVVGAGFRDYQLEEQLEFLTKSGYTAVVFSQKETKKDGVQERYLHGIFSPGTYVSGIESEMGMGLGGKTLGRTTNHVMCIWSEVFSKGKCSKSGITQHRLVIGVSVMNIFSGQSFVLEYEKPIEQRWTEGAVKYIYNPSLFDELERYVYTYQPNETLIIGSLEGIDAVLDYTGLRNTCPMNHVLIDCCVLEKEAEKDSIKTITKEEKIARCKKMKYIQAVLGSVFGEKAISHCSEWDYYVMATRSFCYLLDFIAEHRPELIRKVCMPVFHNTTDRVVLANHTLQQLNILEVEDAKGWLDGVGGLGGNRGNLRSVVGFLNRALTPMGKRRVQEALVSPTFCETVLEREYGMIETLLEEDSRTGAIDIIRDGLRGVRDIERISRQLLLKRLCPGLLHSLYISLEKIVGIQTHLSGKMPKSWCEGVVENIWSGGGGGCEGGMDVVGGKLLKYISFRVDLEACRGINTMNFAGEQPVIWNEEIERMTREILEKETLFIQAMEDCNRFLEQDWVHLKKTEKGQWSLETTKLRGKQMQNKIDETLAEGGVLVGGCGGGKGAIDVSWLSRIKIIKQGSSESMVAITSEELVKASVERMEWIEKRTSCMLKLYQDFLVEFCNKWYDALIGYGRYAGVIDVLQCKAYLAREYHYCRPRIMDSDAVDGVGKSVSDSASSSSSSSSGEDSGGELEKGGKIRAKGLRHVLIEHLQQREIYVANDVYLGQESEEGRGWLIYGTNAVGKTSLIRAVGIAIIMAQAGFYVPCMSFEFRPYRAIYTRILGNDNLFKGMSSFDVEMSELRVILRESDAHSLILGDELCSGTEMESALSIFVASLEHLVAIQSSFLFATHFHEIVYYSEIERMKKEGGIGLKHLTVHYDAESGKLVYDRRLKEGAGSALYGLEVCKSLYLPVEFIDRAYEIRKKYGGGIGGRGMICKTGGGEAQLGVDEERSMIRLDDESSTYNSLKMRGACERCHREMGEEVHHIIPQKKANRRGMIMGEKGEVFHKNHKANLMTVCHACHLLEHGGNFSL